MGRFLAIALLSAFVFPASLARAEESTRKENIIDKLIRAYDQSDDVIQKRGSEIKLWYCEFNSADDELMRMEQRKNKPMDSHLSKEGEKMFLNDWTTKLGGTTGSMGKGKSPLTKLKELMKKFKPEDPKKYVQAFSLVSYGQGLALDRVPLAEDLYKLMREVRGFSEGIRKKIDRDAETMSQIVSAPLTAVPGRQYSCQEDLSSMIQQLRHRAWQHCRMWEVYEKMNRSLNCETDAETKAYAHPCTPEFYQAKNKAELKKDYEVERCGGGGQNGSVEYYQTKFIAQYIEGERKFFDAGKFCGGTLDAVTAIYSAIRDQRRVLRSLINYNRLKDTAYSDFADQLEGIQSTCGSANTVAPARAGLPTPKNSGSTITGLPEPK